MLCLLLGSQVYPVPAKPVNAALTLWSPLAPGISYREFFLPGPNRAYVARLERSNPQAIIESGIAQGRLSGGLETVRQIAERYDQSLGAWGGKWGTRNQVVVAINGSFYDPETGIPRGGQVQSGWYAKHFEELQNGSGFAWTLDRRAFIGGCVVHRPAKQLITFLNSGQTMPFDDINLARGKNSLVIYTPQFDAATPKEEQGVEVQVQMSQPMQLVPLPEMVTGTIRQVFHNQGSTPLPFDSLVLSASGAAADRLHALAQIGAQVGVSQEIKHFQPDCKTPNPDSWTRTYASISGSFTLLRDGVLQHTDDLGALVHNPRTAIAFNQDYVFFIVVDGRDSLRSRGKSIVELGIFAKMTLGATWAIAQDGGGSSTMVVNGQVKNHPNADLKDQPGSSLSNGRLNAPAMKDTERAVANSLFMAVQLPKEISIRFRAGDRIAIIGSDPVNLRLGPGTNYAALSTLPPNTEGVVVDGGLLNGVLAKGTYWWKAAFGDLTGWVSEDYLVSR